MHGDINIYIYIYIYNIYIYYNNIAIQAHLILVYKHIVCTQMNDFISIAVVLIHMDKKLMHIN